MQPPQMITFHCPSCGMKLQVPEQMAGVTGPCPQCAASIIAPPAAAPPAAPVSPPPPSPQPQPAGQRPEPQVQPQVPQQVPQQPAPAAPAPLQKTAVNAPAGESSAPAVDAPLVNKVHRSHAPRRSRWMRVVFPLAFLAMAAVLVLVVLQAAGFVDLLKSGKQNAAPPAAGGPEPGPAEAPVEPNGTEAATPPAPAAPSPAAPDAAPDAVPAAPVAPPKPAAKPETAPPAAPDATAPAAPPAGEFPDLSPPPPGELTSKPPAPAAAKNPPKAGSLVKKARFKANEVLDQFLAAGTLEERLPLMTKSSLTREQLEASCLAGPLKPLKSNYFSEMVPRLEDDMRQYLYYVAFEDKEEERERLRMVVQLVERPGVHPPRVHADAFIEHYEKWLEAYAKKPSKKITTFHCIAEARTAELVKNLPEEIKKQMIRLVISSHPGGKPAFDAFLNKNSPLMERIGARGDFPYVEPRFCVLSFRWNTENPKLPYIELVDIVTMGWEK